MEAYIW